MEFKSVLSLRWNPTRDCLGWANSLCRLDSIMCSSAILKVTVGKFSLFSESLSYNRMLKWEILVRDTRKQFMLSEFHPQIYATHTGLGKEMVKPSFQLLTYQSPGWYISGSDGLTGMLRRPAEMVCLDKLWRLPLFPHRRGKGAALWRKKVFLPFSNPVGEVSKYQFIGPYNIPWSFGDECLHVPENMPLADHSWKPALWVSYNDIYGGGRMYKFCQLILGKASQHKMDPGWEKIKFYFCMKFEVWIITLNVYFKKWDYFLTKKNQKPTSWGFIQEQEKNLPTEEDWKTRKWFLMHTKQSNFFHDMLMP